MDETEICGRSATNVGEYVNNLGAAFNDASDRIEALNEHIGGLNAEIQEKER
jgi:hypothetical protein